MCRLLSPSRSLDLRRPLLAMDFSPVGGRRFLAVSLACLALTGLCAFGRLTGGEFVAGLVPIILGYLGAGTVSNIKEQNGTK